MTEDEEEGASPVGAAGTTNKAEPGERRMEPGIWDAPRKERIGEQPAVRSLPSPR